MFGNERLILETFIVPVCTYTIDGAEAGLTATFGTAFFINGGGAFLTALHVLRQAKRYAEDNSQIVGLCVKSSDLRNVASPILLAEPASDPYDVAIGRVAHSPQSTLRLEHMEIGVGEEVASYGYPLSATVGAGASQDEPLWINGRMLRGHVQRLTKPRDLHIGSHPEGIELSYLLSPGMSGAPVVTLGNVVLGVGVGSYRSELVDDSHIEIDDAGRQFKETKLKIEQYGLAHDLRGLLDWKPSQFDGASLREISLSS